MKIFIYIIFLIWACFQTHSAVVPRVNGIPVRRDDGVVNVVAYGADSTGATLSDAAIIAAVAAAPPGAEVTFPEGTYSIASVSITNLHVRFTGNGTLIHSASATDSMFKTRSDNSVQTIAFEGLTLDGNKVERVAFANVSRDTGAEVLIVNGYKKLIVQDCVFTNYLRAAINLHGSAEIYRSKFFDGAAHNGILIPSDGFSIAINGNPVDSQDCTLDVKDCLFQNTTSAALVYKNPGGVFVSEDVLGGVGANQYSRVSIVNNRFYGSGGSAYGNAYGAIETYNGAQKLIITGNLISYFPSSGIRTERFNDAIIANNYIEHAVIDPGTTAASASIESNGNAREGSFPFTSANGRLNEPHARLVIANNIVKKSLKAAITAQGDDVSIVNNIIEDVVADASGSGTIIGISFVGNRGAIEGNQIKRVAGNVILVGSGSLTNSYSIVRIAGNIFDADTTATSGSLISVGALTPGIISHVDVVGNIILDKAGSTSGAFYLSRQTGKVAHNYVVNSLKAFEFRPVTTNVFEHNYALSCGTGVTAVGATANLRMRGNVFTDTTIKTAIDTVVVVPEDNNNSWNSDYKLYNSYTDQSNWESFSLRTTNTLSILGTDMLGSGLARPLAFRTGGTNHWQIDTNGDFRSLGAEAMAIGGAVLAGNKLTVRAAAEDLNVSFRTTSDLGRSTLTLSGYDTTTSIATPLGGGSLTFWNQLTNWGNYSAIHFLNAASYGVAGIQGESTTQDAVATNNAGRLILSSRPYGGTIQLRAWAVDTNQNFMALGNYGTVAGFGVFTNSIQSPNITASRVVVSDGSSYLTNSGVSAATLVYLDATSSIQGQIDAKAAGAASSVDLEVPLFSGTGGKTLISNSGNFTATGATNLSVKGKYLGNSANFTNSIMVGPDIGDGYKFQVLTDAGNQTASFKTTTSGISSVNNTGFSATTTATSLGGGAKITLRNADATDGNYTQIGNQDSAFSNGAHIEFVNVNHTTHEAEVRYVVRTSGGTVTHAWTMDSAGNLAGKVAGKGVILQNGPQWTSGAGTPEGAITAPIGSIFSRTDGSADTSFYRKESGSGNTGWVASAAPASFISDTTYGSGWNGVTTISPSKNAVYDILHIGDTDDDGKADTLDTLLTAAVWATGLGAITQVQGPSDQPLAIAATAPVQASASVAGNALNLNASNATAGSASGASAGGAMTRTAGNAAAFSGSAAGGAITDQAGTGIGTGAGGAFIATAGTGGSGGGVGGNWIGTAGAGAAGGKPGDLILTAGTQAAAGGTVANGGDITVTATAGRAITTATATGGVGGVITYTTGAGGAESGNTAGTGGAGGAFTVAGGAGGAATGAGGTHLGGNGAPVTITSGAGGNATGESGTRTGGNSGTVTIESGAVGTGATANGTAGPIVFKVGGTQYFGVDATGHVTIGTAGAAIVSILSNTATLDFGSILAAASADLTITVTGAAVNDSVSLGLPAANNAAIAFNAFVSSANTVTVRAFNVGTIAADPDSATYRVVVTHF